MAVGGAPTSPSPPNSSVEYKRLYVTPFNPTLLNVILPPWIQPSAKNISYHSLQTFPEKSYAFLDLLKEDAEKITKKLNGSIIKGSKIRIEEARPSKERSIRMGESTPRELAERKEKAEKGSRKRKRHEEVLPGFELRDRKVRRGWTTPSTETKKSDKRKKDKKDKRAALIKSKFTDKSECLFKTKLPVNVAAGLKEDPTLRRKMDRKSGRKSGREVVVHEFSKSMKHAAFLRGSGVRTGSSVVSEYVEGKGWVDKDGNVVDAEVPTRKESVMAIRTAATKVKKEESSSVVSDTSEEEDEDGDSMKTLNAVTQEASVTSSSGSSFSSDNQEAEAGNKKQEQADSTSESSDNESASQTKTSPTSKPSSPTTIHPPLLQITIPSVETTPVQVHPLEALYKRNRTAASEATTTPFSFFNNEEGEGEVSSSPSRPSTLSIPMTPFTKQDYEHRGVRSAAPTPDTAYPRGKAFPAWPGRSHTSFFTHNQNSNSNSNSNSNEEDEEDEADEEDEEDSTHNDSHSKAPPGSKSTTDKTPTHLNPTDAAADTNATPTDFTKWFYENRGEANRAWKKRRKVVGKEMRLRENRKRGGGER